MPRAFDGTVDDPPAASFGRCGRLIARTNCSRCWAANRPDGYRLSGRPGASAWRRGVRRPLGAIALRTRVVADTAAPPVDVGPCAPARSRLARSAAIGAGTLTALFRPDPWSGTAAYANNGWLQELPKPLTKLTWDNAALISPATAARLGLANEQVVDLRPTARPRSARPVWIMPGHAPDCVTLPLGFGRTVAGRIGRDAGFDAYRHPTVDIALAVHGLRHCAAPGQQSRSPPRSTTR